MERLGVWWAIAGGWAIDLWLDAVTREHHDLEVVVRRADQQVVHDGLGAEWDMSCLDPPGTPWRPWPSATWIGPPAFQLKARGASFEFDLFLESSEHEEWVFRRDSRIRCPLDDLTVVSASGIPFLRPEIQLLYMAKSNEPKNELDFRNARERLGVQAVTWLRQALYTVHPGHPWLDQLNGGASQLG
jgi:Aminoglycoside-2''-adenylyltransferase